MIQITTYYDHTYIWDSYEEELNFYMIAAIEKNAAVAFNYIETETKKLYKIYLKDGNTIYTDLAAYRKILKFAREQGVDVDVR